MCHLCLCYICLYKILKPLSACRIHQCKKIPTSSHFQSVLLNYPPPSPHTWNLQMSYVKISKWESVNTWKWALQGGEAAGLRGGAGSAGEQREVTGVHDETGVQVQTLWGDKTDQRGETSWLALTSTIRMKTQPKTMFFHPHYYLLQHFCSLFWRLCVDAKAAHSPWSKLSFLLDEPSPRPSMSTRSLLTSESFNALRVTSAREEGSESIWTKPNRPAVLLPHLLSSVSWWAWTEKGCSACSWTQPPERSAQPSSQVRRTPVQAAWPRLSSSQFFWATRRKLGLCYPRTAFSSLCS